LIEAALRVLGDFNKNISPDPRDAEAVREAVPSTQPEMPLNVLAAYIVQGAPKADTPGQTDGAAVQDDRQTVLIDNLSAELDLAFTLVQTAQVGRQFDTDGSLSAITKAALVLEQIRRFSGRVRDRKYRARVEARGDELEAALRAAKVSPEPQ
jgi:hypothetical protein